MSPYNAMVWIDPSHAYVMHINPDAVEESLQHLERPDHELHARNGVVGSERAVDGQDYFHEVARALAGAREIVVVGPAQAKLQLIKHLHVHDVALMDRVIGIETVDHPRDAQLVAYARQYFFARDRLI